jgi:pimeloyl-ACP methyl ester carboxylesterase
MPSLTLPHITIDYAEHGDPAGTPVLLLHGFPDAPIAWHPLIQHWTSRPNPPVRFLAPAQRGYAATTVTDPAARSGQVAALADDALQLLKALNIPRAIIVGHDWGARAAYAAAALEPQRVQAVLGLASEYVAVRNTGILPHPQERDYWYQWFFHTPQGEQSLTRDRAGLCRYLWQLWSPTWNFADAELNQAAEAWANPQFVATVLHYYRTRHNNAPGTPLYDSAHARLAAKPRIAVPTWFVTGLADACNHPASSLGQQDWFTAGFERIELPGIGHFIHREAPEAVATVLATVLASVLAPTGAHST